MVVPLVARGKTLGILGMTLKDAEYELKQTRIALAETVASQIATAVENAQLYAQTEKALDVAERDLEIGREIQSGFFPPYLPEIPGWELTTYFKAARQVSGDFYDVFPLKNSSHVCLVVADVCDKGVGAALFMVLLRSLIRSYSEFHEENASVNDLLYGTAHKVNRYIVDTHGQSNMFATLFLGILEPESNSLYYVNGGHDSPRLFSATGRLKHTLLPTGPAFGFSADLEFDIESCLFDPGDMLFACTDGLSEARDPDGHFYTDERLTAQAGRGWPSAFSAVKHLELDVSTHMGDQVQYDDITLLALRRQRKNEIVCHEFTQKAVLSGLPLFRRFVAEVASRMKLAPGPSEHMQLAVDEACSNLILHGYKGMEAGEIVLKVKVTKEVFQVQIEDTGHSFDPSFLDPPELGEDLNERPIGGLGIFMITQLVDELSYDSKEGRNYLVLRINYSTNTN
jgi:serine phosphatase RsbU (regulator of sigma subunit)/anti-sigma regulatory factor (Ser/Thr protein kinase)